MSSKLNVPRLLELTRHGDSMAQWSRRECGRAYQGDENPPLSPLGKLQAAALGRARRGTARPDVIVASGLDRAKGTAEIFVVEAGWNLPILVEPAFNEQSYGLMAHLSETEQEQRFAQDYRRKLQQGLWFFRPPGGESWEDVAYRMRPGYARVCNQFAGQHVMQFGHSSGNQVLRMIIEDWTVSELLAVDLALSTNCATTSYELDAAGNFVLKAAYHRPPEVIALG